MVATPNFTNALKNRPKLVNTAPEVKRPNFSLANRPNLKTAPTPAPTPVINNIVEDVDGEYEAIAAEIDAKYRQMVEAPQIEMKDVGTLDDALAAFKAGTLLTTVPEAEVKEEEVMTTVNKDAFTTLKGLPKIKDDSFGISMALADLFTTAKGRGYRNLTIEDVEAAARAGKDIEFEIECLTDAVKEFEAKKTFQVIKPFINQENPAELQQLLTSYLGDYHRAIEFVNYFGGGERENQTVEPIATDSEGTTSATAFQDQLYIDSGVAAAPLDEVVEQVVAPSSVELAAADSLYQTCINEINNINTLNQLIKGEITVEQITASLAKRLNNGVVDTHAIQTTINFIKSLWGVDKNNSPADFESKVESAIALGEQLINDLNSPTEEVVAITVEPEILYPQKIEFPGPLDPTIEEPKEDPFHAELDIQFELDQNTIDITAEAIPVSNIVALAPRNNRQRRTRTDNNNIPKLKEIKQQVYGLLNVATSKEVKQLLITQGFTPSDLRRKDSWQAILTHLTQTTTVNELVAA